MMTEVWDIVYDLEEKSPCLFVKNGERWKNEGKIKEIKTTNEVGVVMVSRSFFLKCSLSFHDFCEHNIIYLAVPN